MYWTEWLINMSYCRYLKDILIDWKSVVLHLYLTGYVGKPTALTTVATNLLMFTYNLYVWEIPIYM